MPTVAPDDLGSRLARSGWRSVFSGRSLRLWCTGLDEAPPFRVTHCPEGVVLGPLFRASALRADATDPTPSTPECEAWLCDADQMVRDGWGDYVAFHASVHAHCVRILKDPAGLLPAMHVAHDGMHFVFSSLPDAIELGLGPFRVNRDYLRRYVCGTQPDSHEHILDGVTRLAGGESLEIDFDRAPARVMRRQHWDPAAFALEQRLEDPAAAQDALHATALACTRAWSSQHPRILHRLSGGLDSSIVLGCLQHTPSSVVSYTYFDPNSRSDARTWARLAATHAGVPCLEHSFVPEQVPLPQITALAPTLAPIALLPFLQRAALERALCAEHGASAVFTGLGGDSVFCRDSASLAVLDHVALNGATPRALALCAAVARHTDQSVWGVLMDTARHGLGAPRELHSACERLSQLTRPELLRCSVTLPQPHPWLDRAWQLPSLGRRLAALLQPSEFYDLSTARSQPSPIIVSPLLSQPMVELCLRIPTYVHFHRGVERGLARRAFSREVPAAILRRRWKDRAPGVVDRILATHRAFVREFLLEGVLVSEGLLSKPALEAALGIDPGPRAAHSAVTAVEILTHLDTEAWLRHWR